MPLPCEREQRVGVADDERDDREGAGQRGGAQHLAALGALAQRQPHDRRERQDGDAPGVLRRRCDSQAEAGERVIAPARGAKDAGGGPQRELERDERRDVVERELGVEDRQEGDRHQRRGEQCDAPLEKTLRDEVEEPDGEHTEQRGEDPREHPDLGRIHGERMRERRTAAEVQLEDDRQHVREGGRVVEIVGIALVAEQRDRVRHEVLVLVGVVDVGQAALDAPEAQQQREHEDGAEGTPPQCARR